MTKPIEKALEKIPNRFLLTTVLARRWENIIAGAPPLVETRPGQTQVDVVFQEIIQDRVQVIAEEKRIELAGIPRVEENEEALLSEAYVPGEKSGRDLLNKE